MEYTVKNVKSFQGMEGYGFSCSLYRKGMKIGTVTDTASGGMIDFYLNEGEKGVLDTYCSTLPVRKIKEMTIPTDCDIFISGLVEKWEKLKQYTRWCKKQTIFRVDGDKKDEYRVISKFYDDKVKNHLEKKYKDKGLVIVNELIK